MRDILSDLEQGGDKPTDPVQAAQGKMRADLPKRFYQDVSVEKGEGGYAVLLDGRSVKTPARKLLAVPSERLAEVLAAEWAAQGDHINPMTMPLTRLLNTALDGVAEAGEAVFEDALRYAGSDLLCYRAGAPESLVARQNEAWDPWLDWISNACGARFVLAEGVMHVDQPPEAARAASVIMRRHTEPLRLAALHVVTTMTGSLILALALAEGAADAGTVWQAAHVDEDFNIAQWGEDHEAAARREVRRKEFDAAALVLETSGL